MLITMTTSARRVQFSLGRGNEMRRLVWWPRHGQIGVRLFADYWLSCYWQSPEPRRPRE